MTHRLRELEALIADRMREHPPCNDTPKTVPAYCNTGCCILDDGDITGMELEDGVLRLVKWPAGGTEPRETSEEERIEALLREPPPLRDTG